MTFLGREIEGTEIVQARTVRSKLFDLGAGRRKLVTSPVPVHFALEGALHDIDLTPRDDGDAWLIDRAPFILRIAKQGLVIDYEGRLSGRRARFEHVAAGAVEFDGFRRGWWQTGSQNKDAVDITPAGIAVEAWIEAAAADPEFKWTVAGDVEESLAGEDLLGNPAEVVEKAFTGRVSVEVDPVTRMREWRDEAAYPVMIR